MRTNQVILPVSAALCVALVCVANAPAPALQPLPAQPATPVQAAKPAKPAQPTEAEAAFDRIKSLAGTWDSSMGGDGKVTSVVTYRIIANGSAVVETLLPGTPEEMETIFTRDGNRVICTHYCAAGSQPRLAATKITPDSMTFEMVDATNLPDRNVSHMGGLKVEFMGKDHFKTTWTSFENGKASETVSFDMKRRPASK